MGFSFRKLFSDKEGGDAGQASPSFGSSLPDQRDGNTGNSSVPPQGSHPAEAAGPLFGNAQPTDRGSFEQMFAGARPNGAEGGDGQFPTGAAEGVAPGLGATYLAGELLHFIPPALASPDAIPMGQPVQVDLPADGSRDVKLSDLYLGCPQLFATEITPLNDSQVTLPEPAHVGGDGGAGPMPGSVPLAGADVPPNPFGNPMSAEDQRNAPPSGGGVPNPFDPRGGGAEQMGAGAGAAPRAATPAPMSWQQETEAQPAQPEPSQQPSAAPQVEPPAGAEVVPTAPTESASPAVPGNSAPAFAPVSEGPLAEEEAPQESPFGGNFGGGDDFAKADMEGSPFDLDEDNPFFLAEDDDDDEVSDEQLGNDGVSGVDGGFGAAAAASASPFDSNALPALTSPSVSPAEQMGALDPPASSPQARAEQAVPWPAAETESEIETPSFGNAFSGGNVVSDPATASPSPVEAPEAEAEVVAESVEPTTPSPASSSIFGSPSLADQSAVAAANTTVPPAAEALATGFAAAVPASQAPSLLSPSPFGTSAPAAESETTAKKEDSASVAENAEPVRDESDVTLSFAVRDLLFPHQPEALGFSAESLPYGLVAELPLKRIETQLASGRVTVSLGELAVAVEPPHGGTLAQGNQSLEIELPPTALFHQLERVSEAKTSAAAAAENVDSSVPEETASEPRVEERAADAIESKVAANFNVPAVVEVEEEIETPLPPAGASSGFSTPFSQLAKEDEESADPVHETRFAAKPASEDPGKMQMRFGNYPTPNAENDPQSEAEDAVDSGAADKSTPPPLPALKEDSHSGTAGESGGIRASQIPGPLRKSGTLVPGTKVEADSEAVAEPEAKAEPVADNEPKIEKPTRPSRAITISVGPGAVTAASLEKKLAPLGDSAVGAETVPEAADQPGRANDDDDDRAMHATREDTTSAANSALDLDSERDEEFGPVDSQSDDGDDSAESMTFTSSRPDHELAQGSKSKAQSAMAEDSLDTLPTFADLMAREDKGEVAAGKTTDSDSEGGEHVEQQEADFFAELEPPPFSFQSEVQTKQTPVAAAPEVDEVATTTRDRIDAGAMGGDEFRDLELRAIFGTTEEFTLQRVAELTLDLCSSIDSCALLTHGRAVDVSRRGGFADDGEARRRAQQVRAMHRNLRDLADNAGLTQAQALTLHTDREAISFFQRGEICLTVRHDRSGFPAGVREKLMLVAHGVAAMEERR